MKTVRYGIIGFGGIALNRIAREGFGLDRTRFSPTEGVELVGVTSPSGRLRAEATDLGVAWYATVDELLADQSIDAVFVASPNAMHGTHGEAVLGAGKHCLMEKPITVDRESAQRLSALARRSRLSLSVNHMMVHNVWNITARDALAAGRIGEVSDLVLHMEFLYGAVPEEAASWRCARIAERGGPIGDVGSHCLYMAEFLYGEPIVSVSAAAEPRVLDIAVETGASIHFQAESGRQGTVRVSFAAGRGGALGTILNLGFEAYGSGGILRSYGTLFQLSGHPDEPFQQRLEIETTEGRTEIAPTLPVRNIYRAVIEEHADSIRTGRPDDGETALHNLDLILAAYADIA